MFIEQLKNVNLNDKALLRRLMKKRLADVTADLAGEEVFSAVSAQLTGVFDKSGAVKDLAEGFGFLKFLKSIDFGTSSEEEDEEEEETSSGKKIAFEDLI